MDHCSNCKLSPGNFASTYSTDCRSMLFLTNQEMTNEVCESKFGKLVGRPLWEVGRGRWTFYCANAA